MKCNCYIYATGNDKNKLQEQNCSFCLNNSKSLFTWPVVVGADIIN